MFNFFDKLKTTVSKTAQALVSNVVDTIASEEEFSEFVLDDMEDLLISADLGVNYASELTDKLRKQNKIKPSQVKEFLQNEFIKTLDKAGSSVLDYKDNELNIYFITGVNGAGKTTLIGKMAYMFKQQGKKVLIAAGDTELLLKNKQISGQSVLVPISLEKTRLILHLLFMKQYKKLATKNMM